MPLRIYCKLYFVSPFTDSYEFLYLNQSKELFHKLVAMVKEPMHFSADNN